MMIKKNWFLADGKGGNKYKLGTVGCKCSSIGTMGIKPHYQHCTAGRAQLNCIAQKI